MRGADIDKVLALALEENPNDDGVEVADLLEPSEVYDCAREREAMGTVRLFVESEGPGVLLGDRDFVSVCICASGEGMGNPLTAATSCASVQSGSWSSSPLKKGASRRSIYTGAKMSH